MAGWWSAGSDHARKRPDRRRGHGTFRTIPRSTKVVLGPAAHSPQTHKTRHFAYRSEAVGRSFRTHWRPDSAVRLGQVWRGRAARRWNVTTQHFHFPSCCLLADRRSS